ncbi:MAG: hypothetical protein ACI4VU_02255 [Methanobrevibacter sp.]
MTTIKIDIKILSRFNNKLKLVLWKRSSKEFGEWVREHGLKVYSD